MDNAQKYRLRALRGFVVKLFFPTHPAPPPPPPAPPLDAPSCAGTISTICIIEGIVSFLVISRTVTKSISPAFVTPPPMTIRCGLKE